MMGTRSAWQRFMSSSFCRHRVDTVGYIVKLREVDFVSIRRHIEHLVFMHDATGIDVVDSFGGYIHLDSAHRGGMKLAVDVCQTKDTVVIKESSSPAPLRQALPPRIGPHTADTEDGHSRAN